MAFHFPFTTLVAMQKNCPDFPSGGLDRFLEIIYNARNTPAVGVNFIQAPNRNEFRVRTAEMTAPASHSRFTSARAFVRQLSGARRDGV
jgi:hypothetical protein